MNIPCLIIDDEPSSQNLLKSFIHKPDYLESNPTIINANKIPLDQKYKKEFLAGFNT